MRECKGVVWGFSWLGATCWRFCCKTQKDPAKCLYSVMYTVYSVLLASLWLKSVPGWPAISVSTFQQSRVGQIVWFGSLSAISQLASRVGEGGGVRHLCLHSVTQPNTTCMAQVARAGRGVVFPPLGFICLRSPPLLWPHTTYYTLYCIRVYSILIHTGKGGGERANQREG